MRLAYIAGKYRDERGEYYVYENILAARRVAAELWAMGFAVVTTHANAFLLGGALGIPASVWLKGDQEILSRCDLIVMVPGWESSAGASDEHSLADTLSIPRYYWPEDHGELERVAKRPKL